MPPSKPPHGQHVALNTPENASKAVESSRASLAKLEPGQAWRHRTPRGDMEVKGALLLNGMPTVVLHFNPVDGSILPKGLHALSEGNPDILNIITERLRDLPQELTVLEGAEFREPESCWAVPLAHRGRIVGHLKVSSDGLSILPDKKAMEELGGRAHPRGQSE